MKLCFLDQTYSASVNQVETNTLEHSTCFLDSRYTIRRPVLKVNPQLGISKKYRGVAYGI